MGWTKRYAMMAWTLFMVALTGCGFGRGDGGPFCRDPCGKPGQIRDFFCNCYVPDEEPDDSLADGLVFLEEAEPCNPTSAGKTVWVRNATPHKVQIVTRKEAWEANTKLWDKKITSVIEPRGRDYLGCEGDLYYEFRYYILQVTRRSRNALLWLDDPADSQVTGRERGPGPALVSFQLPGNEPNRSCRELCPDLATTARCSTASVASTARRGLSFLYASLEQLSRDNGLISPDELRGWFDLSADADGCARGPTAFVGARFMNVGVPCALEVPLAENLVAELVVPMILSGTVESSEGDLQVQLSQETSMVPSLHFYDEHGQPAALDADFGGSILSVEADASSVFMKTRRSRCVGVAF